MLCEYLCWFKDSSFCWWKRTGTSCFLNSRMPNTFSHWQKWPISGGNFASRGHFQSSREEVALVWAELLPLWINASQSWSDGTCGALVCESLYTVEVSRVRINKDFGAYLLWRWWICLQPPFFWKSLHNFSSPFRTAKPLKTSIHPLVLCFLTMALFALRMPLFALAAKLISIY